MWQLVFALCHRLFLNKHLKGCVMVMADPSDLGHGKNNNNLWLKGAPKQGHWANNELTFV